MNKEILLESYEIEDILDDDNVKAILKDFENYKETFDFSELDLDEEQLTESDKKVLYEDMRKQLFLYIRQDVKENLSFTSDEKFIKDSKELNLSTVSSFDEDDYEEDTMELLRPYIYDNYAKLYNYMFGVKCEEKTEASDEGRFFTALDADKVKIGSEGYFANDFLTLKKHIEENLSTSKVSEIKSECFSNRFVTDSNEEYALFYMVKVSNDYAPYNNTKEMREDYLKRMGFTEIKNNFGTPVMRIKDKNTNTVYFILGIEENKVYTVKETIDMKALYDNYIFADGLPCGKK